MDLITAFTDLQSPLAGNLAPRSTSSPACPLLSDDGVPIERISRLVGHTGTTLTEKVYRHQLRPVIEHGAVAMDRIFPVAGT